MSKNETLAREFIKATENENDPTAQLTALLDQVERKGWNAAVEKLADESLLYGSERIGLWSRLRSLRRD